MADAEVCKYRNGKIYELVYKDKVYIGSTTKTLKQRYNCHKCNSNTVGSTCTSKVLFELANIDGGTVVINLIEDYPCNDRIELQARERFHIEQCQDRVNRNIPGRSDAEWYHDNRDRLTKYRQDNKEMFAERDAEKYQANKDKIRAKQAEYRQANKAKIAAQQAIKVECPCGSTFRQGDNARHSKTQRHIDYLKANPN